jgi:hypothetical protein
MTKTTAADVKRARVAIELDGDELHLIPSPDAIIFLSGKYDGFQPLLGALQRLNIQAAIDVVTSGLGVEGKAAKNVAGQVVSAGPIELMPKLVEFVMILANGGKPLKEQEEDGEGNPRGS